MDDLISRQDVLDVITVIINGFMNADNREWLEDMCVAIDEIPSAVKSGKWIKSAESKIRPYMCSNCGSLYDVDTVMGELAWKYCPNCGARMERNDETCD